MAISLMARAVQVRLSGGCQGVGLCGYDTELLQDRPIGGAPMLPIVSIVKSTLMVGC